MNHFTPSMARPISALLVSFLTCITCLADPPVSLFNQSPVSVSKSDSNSILVDFGKVAFGNIQLHPPAGATGNITVHFGEKSKAGRIDREPPGSVRYRAVTIELTGDESIVVAPPADKRNTRRNEPPAILTPKAWGVVLPFRWVEIEGWPGELLPDHITRRAAFATTWDDDAASFESSDEMLNEIWNLCRYSIKATTFAGVYVDGDRERIPYEADAYLNQISHYATDNDAGMARRTFDHLMQHATWPSEWAPHMVFMAHADWMHTGDVDWIEPRYESLKTKLLLDRVAADGLVQSNANQQKKADIVDWPKTERDDFVFTKVNTVVNAFHLAALNRMVELARAIGKDDDAEDFERRSKRSLNAFQSQLFDTDTGLYRDGVETNHSSHHANFFPLAFDLAPINKRKIIVDWLSSREMPCSVYGAQYLLEALFQNGGEEKALQLITAATDRSWRHMVESGTSITWEAWDTKYKPNQDWNHAWGAAPANLLPRFVLGAQPLTAGWSRAVIRPCPGSLKYARGTIPTPRGSILIDWKNESAFQMSVRMPEGMAARIEIPAGEHSAGVAVNGQRVNAQRVGPRWVLTEDVSGSVEIAVEDETLNSESNPNSNR